ncbi:hypothetical protein, partial [Pseudanabaena sp. SR411]|uniref:hypothetical protein n=1 Tax=Pseudanabaena sp. SR411 TaxID=1980935 RepID=UPI001C3CDE65
RSTKTTLIPNPKYSPFHSLGFAQFSILWVASSCSFSDFLNQLSLDSSKGKGIGISSASLIVRINGIP